jgi:hypothetical protein
MVVADEHGLAAVDVGDTHRHLRPRGRQRIERLQRPEERSRPQ